MGASAGKAVARLGAGHPWLPPAPRGTGSSGDAMFAARSQVLGRVCLLQAGAGVCFAERASDRCFCSLHWGEEEGTARFGVGRACFSSSN